MVWDLLRKEEAHLEEEMDQAVHLTVKIKLRVAGMLFLGVTR